MSKQKLIELKEKVEALNAELKEVYKDGLKEYALELFIKHPKIKGFSWVQYTPYFNDGEPCEFGVSVDDAGMLISTKDTDEWIHGYQVTYYQRNKNGGYNWKLPKLLNEEYRDYITIEEMNCFQQDLHEFAKDVLYPFEKQIQALLGEGRVIVTPLAIEVEDYDHD